MSTPVSPFYTPLYLFYIFPLSPPYMSPAPSTLLFLPSLYTSTTLDTFLSNLLYVFPCTSSSVKSSFYPWYLPLYPPLDTSPSAPSIFLPFTSPAMSRCLRSICLPSPPLFYTSTPPHPHSHLASGFDTSHFYVSLCTSIYMSTPA